MRAVEGIAEVRMRILFWQQNPVFGACETYLASLIGGAQAQRPQWNLAVAVPASTMAEWRQRVPDAVELVESSTSLGRAVRIMRSHRPDVLHVNDPALPALLAGRVTRVPQVLVTWHTPSHRIAWNRPARRIWSLSRRNSRLTVITLSAENRAQYLRTYAASVKRVTVVEPGLDTAPFVHLPDRSETRRALGFEDDALQLVTVARLAPQKRLDLMLDAVRQLNEVLAEGSSGRFVKANLTVLGEGDERPRLDSLAKRLGVQRRVRFLGRREDVVAVLAASDVFLLSSDYEGLPFAMLEALGSGLPVVSTEVGGIGGVIDRSIGILCPAGDAHLLARAILDLMSSEPTMSERSSTARRTFFERFTLDRMVAETLALYCDNPPEGVQPPAASGHHAVIEDPLRSDENMEAVEDAN